MSDIHDNIELSDSDDDLLGITDTPIDIRSRLHNHDYIFSAQQRSSDIRTPFHNPTLSSTSVRNKKFSPMKSNKFPTETSQSSSSSISQQNSKSPDDGWIHCRRHRKPKNYIKPIQASSIKPNTTPIFDNWTNQDSNTNFTESSDNWTNQDFNTNFTESSDKLNTYTILSETHSPLDSTNTFIHASNQPRKDSNNTTRNDSTNTFIHASNQPRKDSNNTTRNYSFDSLRESRLQAFLENIMPVKSSTQVESPYLSSSWNIISHNSTDSFSNLYGSHHNGLTKYRTDDSSLALHGHPKGCYGEIQSTPTMEIIDINNSNYMSNKFDIQQNPWDSKMEMKQNRYQRMREIRGVIGFIVNVHDATNFDIDLEMSPELHEKYLDVISNQYTYQDLDLDFLENPNLNRTTEITPKIGTTYRCRLRGVGINQLAQNVHTWKSNQMCVEVKQLIDRTDGWIICTLSDVDVYQRLLVDIVINTYKGPINLRDYLLSRMEHEDNPIFYPYSGKRDGRYRTFKYSHSGYSSKTIYEATGLK